MYCCDLLEKSYFCSIANNFIRSLFDSLSVVICLKNRTFAVSQTTNKPSSVSLPRCDLLEKSYFCSIANNTKPISTHHLWVVICLKNRTFAVSQTTSLLRILYRYRLWFAWKIVLLQYRKQPRHILHFRIKGCDLLEKSYFCSIANNLNTISICTTNRYKDLRNKKNETAKRNPTLCEWDFFFLIMPVR